MINVAEIVADADLQAPQPFLILRSVGTFVSGGFQSEVVGIPAYGPVQRATDRETQMYPEADRVGGIMNFWWTQPIYSTRGAASVPSTAIEVPTVSGSTLILNAIPPADSMVLYRNGSALSPGFDYSINGQVISLFIPPQPTDKFCAVWPIEVQTGQSAADKIVYPNPGGETYRVLAVRHYPGSGFWRAAGTRESAI